MTFNLFGLKIEISFLFTGLICLLLLYDKTGLMSVGLFSAYIHEIGHFIAMAISHTRPEKLKFCAYGIIINKNVNRCTDKERMLIYSGGCILNIVIGALCYIIFCRTDNFALLYLSASNFITAFFSALPIHGLDGYDILNLILSLKMKITTAEKISKTVSCVFCVLPIIMCVCLTTLGAFSLNLMITCLYLVILLVISLF